MFLVSPLLPVIRSYSFPRKPSIKLNAFTGLPKTFAQSKVGRIIIIFRASTYQMPAVLPECSRFLHKFLIKTPWASLPTFPGNRTDSREESDLPQVTKKIGQNVGFKTQICLKGPPALP